MAFPTISACFLCEQVRPELGNKFILLGFYGVAPYIRVQVQNFALPIQLVFVFAGGPGHGHFRIDLRITSANGAAFDAPGGFEANLIQQAGHSNIFMGFQGVLPGPGNYMASLLANGATQFQAPFALEPAPAPPAQIH
jgi:hypothetical protein